VFLIAAAAAAERSDPILTADEFTPGSRPKSFSDKNR
jgi:hypothetical protein